MTEERLAGYYDWAGHPDRDAQAARIVRELVREVRRLRAEVASRDLWIRVTAIAPEPPALDEAFWLQEDPEPVPVLRGILAGITAADVYGVYG